MDLRSGSQSRHIPNDTRLDHDTSRQTITTVDVLFRYVPELGDYRLRLTTHLILTPFGSRYGNKRAGIPAAACEEALAAGILAM